MLHLRGDDCRSLKAPRSFFLRYRLDSEFKAATLRLQPGDRIALYTDGVIETFDPSGGMFNVAGLEDFLVKTQNRSLAYLPSLLETDLHQFREGSPVEDDITFLIIEIK